jgi:hypothetical protein
MINAEQIGQNWNSLMKVIDDNFEGERKEKLKTLYADFEERMMMAPASGIEHFHNAFGGGYVDHVLRVINGASKVYETWQEMGSPCDGYAKEELMFVALNHDLGKIGTKEHAYYIPNPSDWHRKNQGAIFDTNPEIDHMPVQHRSIWLLNQYGITMSSNEMIAIMIHDGLYDESNSVYYKPYGKGKQLKTNLAHIVHQADLMASKIEYELWLSGDGSKKTTIKKQNPHVKATLTSANDDAKDVFASLFGEK